MSWPFKDSACIIDACAASLSQITDHTNEPRVHVDGRRKVDVNQTWRELALVQTVLGRKGFKENKNRILARSGTLG